MGCFMAYGLVQGTSTHLVTPLTFCACLRMAPCGLMEASSTRHTEAHMNHPRNLIGMLFTGLALMVSASAAMAHPDFDRSPHRDARPHYVRPAPRFEHYSHRHHPRMHAIGTRHDRDGDGVPNRFDARPNNPYRH
jgi:hypothetical protein